MLTWAQLENLSEKNKDLLNGFECKALNVYILIMLFLKILKDS